MLTVFKRYEVWYISLKAKIKSSLSIKVFLLIAGSLLFCSFLIYGSIMLFLPKSYVAVSSEQTNMEIDRLVETLSETKLENAENILEQFCENNQATIIFQYDGEKHQYGNSSNLSSNSSEMMSFAQEIKFADTIETYVINIVVPISSNHELHNALLKLLPFLLIIIFAVSFLGAWFCSRLIAKPIIEISQVSKRMAKLDMTWKCTITRSDEIGILADSLNTMSKELSDTMNELETANEQLMLEMEHIEELNKQRQHFFATASHELKTPITIIKGQVESMIMEIGRYKDTRKILPETLHEIENMENLVKEILSISKLELGEIDNLSTLPVTDIVKRVCEYLKPLADEKNITIYQRLTEDVQVIGNQSLFEKALHNIINNAIRHSPVETNVYVTLTDKELLVKNEGITIPQEDLNKIFTPFYRVEKSHNKLTGGSGLGLYLVKNILEKHGLLYTINNDENGVCFKITINSQNPNQN